MTGRLSGVEPSLPDGQKALWQVVAFLLKQVGGSVALSEREQELIRDIDITTVKMYKTEMGTLILRVVEE